MLIVVIAAMIWLMNLNYLMMILPKEKHIEFHNKNHRDNIDVEGIDNIHILDNRQVVAEHIAGVAEHIAGVAASVVEAVVVDIDNKHIQDGNDANVVVVAEEDIEGNIQQGILQ